MSPHDAERMTTRYQLLFVAVERAINEADPLGLLELGAPSSEYAPEIGTIVPRLALVKRLDDITGVLHEEFIRWFGAGHRRSTTCVRGVGASDLGRGYGVSTE